MSSSHTTSVWTKKVGERDHSEKGARPGEPIPAMGNGVTKPL
jgi:hypothetical protein